MKVFITTTLALFLSVVGTVHADSKLPLFQISFDIGKTASVNQSRLNIGGMIGKTGQALHAAFNRPYRLHAAKKDSKTAGYIIGGLALVALAVALQDDDNCHWHDKEGHHLDERCDHKH